MSILLWIIFGGLAGWIASIIMGSNAQMGLLANIIVGIIGAFLGGWIADKVKIGSGQPGVERPSSSIAAFAWAVVGAVILLWLINVFYY